MVDWLLQAENTQQGSNLALFLAIMAAFLHAIFGALQKGKFDPWLMRAAIDLSYGLMALPFALFVVPWPENYMWPLFFGAFVIHTAYKVMQAMAYSRGAFTVVYPVVRGIGPLLTVIVAYFVFSESFNLTQWFGVVILVCGILGLAGLQCKIFIKGERNVSFSYGFCMYNWRSSSIIYQLRCLWNSSYF
jgi:drug/metabolite transporter (DMT)-like permease